MNKSQTAGFKHEYKRAIDTRYTDCIITVLKVSAFLAVAALIAQQII
jgi:hypothetical protein